MASKTVLLIEDSEHDRAMYSKLLYYNGYDVLFAGSGEEGLEKAEAARPDAILLDLVLPGLDGFEVCSRLRELLGDEVPIVILSGMDRDDARARCLEAGATAFMPKPATPFEVLQEMRTLVGDSTPPEAEEPAEHATDPRQPAGEVGPSTGEAVLQDEAAGNEAGPGAEPSEPDSASGAGSA